MMLDNLQDWNRAKAIMLDPLTIRPSEAFVANVMRRVRAWDAPEPWISRWLWPVFTVWAIPAMSLSAAGFTVAFLYAVQPVNHAGDGLILGGHAGSVTTEWKDALPDDQIFNLLVNKP